MYEEIISGLTTFIGKSPTAFHAVANMGAVLRENGYQRLNEGEAWDIRQDLEPMLAFLQEQTVKTWEKQMKRTKNKRKN